MLPRLLKSLVLPSAFTTQPHAGKGAHDPAKLDPWMEEYSAERKSAKWAEVVSGLGLKTAAHRLKFGRSMLV